jgi:hypothetical protein
MVTFPVVWAAAIALDEAPPLLRRGAIAASVLGLAGYVISSYWYSGVVP